MSSFLPSLRNITSKRSPSALPSIYFLQPITLSFLGHISTHRHAPSPRPSSNTRSLLSLFAAMDFLVQQMFNPVDESPGNETEPAIKAPQTGIHRAVQGSETAIQPVESSASKNQSVAGLVEPVDKPGQRRYPLGYQREFQLNISWRNLEETEPQVTCFLAAHHHQFDISRFEEYLSSTSSSLWMLAYSSQKPEDIRRPGSAVDGLRAIRALQLPQVICGVGETGLQTYTAYQNPWAGGRDNYGRSLLP